MHLSCGRSRAAAAQLAGTGASAVGSPPTPSAYPAILCDPLHARPRQRVRVRETVHGLPNSVPVFSDRWYCNEKSVMTAYTSLLFRGIPGQVSRRPSLTL